MITLPELQFFLCSGVHAWARLHARRRIALIMQCACCMHGHTCRPAHTPGEAVRCPANGAHGLFVASTFDSGNGDVSSILGQWLCST